MLRLMLRLALLAALVLTFVLMCLGQGENFPLQHPKHGNTVQCSHVQSVSSQSSLTALLEWHNRLSGRSSSIVVLKCVGNV